MAKQLQLRKGTATEHNTFTGANGEVTVDTTNKTLRVHDGTTAGGTPLATLTGGLVPATQLPSASVLTKGIVKLNDSLTSSDVAEALTAAQGKVLNDRAFGIGQTWQDVTSSRSAGVTYTNSTGKPIQVAINANVNIGSFVANGVTIPIDDYNFYSQHFYIIPNGHTYRLNLGTSGSLLSWAELR